MRNAFESIYEKYLELLASQKMHVEVLDYSKFTFQLTILDQISSIKKSGLTVKQNEILL
jgi:hypothetical protein